MESQRGGFWPRLCSLKCILGWEIVPFISSFLAPTITNLDLTLPHKSNRLLLPTLSLLTHTCCQLQSLSIDVKTFDSLSSSEMGRLISASRHTLHHLEVKFSTPPEIFPVVFNLPRLRNLVLHGPRFPSEIPSEISPLLETIDFTAGTGSNLMQFLRRLSRLTTVSVSCDEITQFSTLLNSLRGATATMHHLCLSPVIVFSRSSTTLLCTFTNLTFLTIFCICGHRTSRPCHFQVTDEDLMDLGRALPRIRTLSLSPYCRTSPCATPKSLIHLSRICSNLEYLSIKIDFASIAGDSDLPDYRAADLGEDGAHLQGEGSRVRMLTVGNSTLPDAPRCEWMIALVLATIFPSIQNIFFNCTSEMNERWSEVWEDILACRKIFHITRAGDAALVP